MILEWNGFTGKNWEFSKRGRTRESGDKSPPVGPGAKPQDGI